MSKKYFKSERIKKTSSFLVYQNINKVFPMFGAFEERKWAEEWKPILIYPNEEIIEEGTTFKTKGNDDEIEYLWIVTKFDPSLYLIQYLVSTDNRFWTITVNCELVENANKTKATVTYTFTGINEKGNKLNKNHLEKIYKENLNDWAEAINRYIAREQQK